MAKLFYIIGASGAGKDSLLNYLRHRCQCHEQLTFAHRYITRSADAGGENHIALSNNEFTQRQQAGCFLMHWSSHQNHYGIGIEVHYWLQNGLNVVVNGSRNYLEQAQRLFPQLVPILIDVDSAILEQRLIARGRESRKQIQQRLQQAQQLQQIVKQKNLDVITNNHSLQQAGDRLYKLITSKSHVTQEISE